MKYRFAFFLLNENYFRETLYRFSIPPTSRMSPDATHEQTFIAIKPDAVQRGLVGEIVKRFEQRGYKLVAMKFVQPSRNHLEVSQSGRKWREMGLDLPQANENGAAFRTQTFSLH